MIIRTKAREGRIPRAFSNQLTETQANPTTPVNPKQSCDRSPRHGRAAVRHVEREGGPAIALCFACWRQIASTETRAVLVSRFNNLFKVRPRLTRAGGVVGALAALLAPIGEGRAMV